MRSFVLLVSLILLFSCKKEGESYPNCRLAGIAAGGNYDQSLITYFNGDTIVRVGSGNSGYTLYYDLQKRLIRREEPVVDPYHRNVFVYNSNNQIIEMKYYMRLSGVWEYQGSLNFEYDNGKMVNVREGGSYDNLIYWQGDNVQKVEHRVNNVVQCTTQFEYDAGKKNPMRQFDWLYFVDGNANYVRHKLPYYFSKNLVVKQESTCPLSETNIFTYTYTPQGLIETMTSQAGVGTGLLWEYSYDCF